MQIEGIEESQEWELGTGSALGIPNYELFLGTLYGIHEVLCFESFLLNY